MDFLCIAPSSLKCYNCGLSQCEHCKEAQAQIEKDIAEVVKADSVSYPTVVE